MTPEQIQEIRERWLSPPERERAQCAPEEVSRAAGDIARLLDEVERLRKCCDEITWQYARLCCRSTGIKPGDDGDPQPPRAPAA